MHGTASELILKQGIVVRVDTNGVIYNFTGCSKDKE
jgi:hypothetical protein